METHEKDLIEALESKGHLWTVAGFAGLGIALWVVFLL